MHSPFGGDRAELAADSGRGLDDLDAEAGFEELQGGRHSGHPGADYCDLRPPGGRRDHPMSSVASRSMGLTFHLLADFRQSTIQDRVTDERAIFAHVPVMGSTV